MRKVLDFNSPTEQYVADAAVLCCFDARLRGVVSKFLEREGILRPDMIVVAGGARTLASPRNPFEQEFILEQFRMSIRLHQTRRAVLMSHSDCATYGGLAAFGGDPVLEQGRHKIDLGRAAELLESRFPGLSVECYFVTFDGILTLKPLTIAAD
ncbi:MAG TPA: carbonic anhydrase [Terriglobales bacterium]|nr:carbonic anhydrase [Terriglobales bacterium]